jgi:hypothetical protein
MLFPVYWVTLPIFRYYCLATLNTSQSTAALGSSRFERLRTDQFKILNLVSIFIRQRSFGGMARLLLDQQRKGLRELQTCLIGCVLPAPR